MNRTITAGLLWLGSMVSAALGHPPMNSPTTAPTTAPSSQNSPDAADHISITHHSLQLNGRTLDYTATVGTMAMKDESKKSKADVFFVAYVKDPEPGAPVTPVPPVRPLMFVFNGGPGAASVWLHLGAAGPKRIEIDATGLPIGPPYKLLNNESTWLDATDLVFIDPVGTGYSRPAEGEKPEDFFGVEPDIRSVGEFIRLYVTRYQRWASPQFLAGESYGTTRAAGLSDYLSERYGLNLNGIVLISSVLNFQTIVAESGNDLPYPLCLPSYTAIAWYHKKLPPDLQADLNKTLAEVKRWAMGEYADALAQGAALPPEQREAVEKKLARYTGLDIQWIRKSDLRIRTGTFRVALLSDQRLITGRFDARITGYNPQPLDNTPDYDPSHSLYLPAYSADFNQYVRSELKYESDLPYDVLSGQVKPWSYGAAGTGYLDVATSLATAMVKNPHLKVMFANGYFDLATPFLSADYTINHMNLSDSLRSNITHRYYPTGHMIYHYPPGRQTLHDDIAAFIRSAVPPGS